MSKYEKYFIMGNDVVSCRNCDRTYKKNKNGSTTTYLRHLKDSHRDLYTEFTKAMDLRTEKDKIQRELDDKQSLKRHFPAVEKPVMQQSGPSKIARNDGLQTIEEAIRLKTRMEKDLEREELLIATALEPTFKLEYFEEDEKTRVIELLKEKGLEYAGKFVANDQQLDTQSESSVEEELDDNPFRAYIAGKQGKPYKKKQPSPNVDAKIQLISEIEKYLELPIQHEDFSSFWSKHVNSVSFPVLKMMARKYHSAPSTSAESERLFSIAKLILNDLRKSLTSSNFSKLLFLHHNLLICGLKAYE